MNSYVLFIGTDNMFTKMKTADIGIYALSLKQAFKECRNEKYALIVWEITENNVNPKTIIYMFRKLTTIPIVIISNKGNCGEVDEKLDLLKAGADLYLENPDEGELTAYIESQIRRYMLLNKRVENIPETISGPSFLFLKKERKVFVCGQEIKLTKTEFDMVYYLALHKGQVVTYKELYEKVWHEKYLYDDANIMAHIRRIRLKIREAPGKPCLIFNIRGIGYKFAEEAFDEPKIAESLKEKQRNFVMGEMKDEDGMGKDELHYEQRERIGSRLRKCRIELELTSEAMAERLGYPVRTYSEVENGNIEISINCILKLEEIYSICSRYILTGKGKPFYA